MHWGYIIATERENNNTKENADEVYFDTPTTGKLQSVNDIDVFKVYVDEAMEIHFEFDVPAAVSYHWDVTIKNDQGDIINSAMNMRVGRSDYEGTDIYAYVKEKGFYYIYVEQDTEGNWSDREYEFTLSKRAGYFLNEYEGNNERSTANVLTLDGDNGTIEKIDNIYNSTSKDLKIFGNLYEVNTEDFINNKYDVDYFEFVLPDGHDTIAIDFDVRGADDPGNDKWDIEFYDTSGSNTPIASKEFISDEEFTFSTKSNGTIYLKVFQNFSDSHDPSFYGFKLKTSNSNPSSSSSSSSSSNESSDDMSKGTDGDDIITLSSGNDEFLVTTGDDFIDGGEGIDTLVIPFDAAAVIRSIKSIEYSTNTELEFGQKYIAIKVLEDGNDWTTAINFEFIRYSNQNDSVSLQKFDGNSSWSLPDKETLTVPNKKGIFQHLNLYDNGYHTINETASHTYKIKSISDSDFEDQIVIGKWSESSRVIETLEPNSNGRYLKWKSGTGDNGKDITVVFEVTYKSTSLYDKFGPFTKEYEIIIPDMVDIVVDQYKLSFVLDPNYPVLTSHNDQDSIQGGTLNFTSKDDLIILTGGGTYRGLGGDDLFFVSNLMATNSNFTMVDTSGSNIIQMPKNTKITKAQFASDSVRLTLDEGRVITINGADNHTFNLGGNVTSGDQGNDFSYSEFAALFGIGLSDLSGVETSNEGYYI